MLKLIPFLILIFSTASLFGTGLTFQQKAQLLNNGYSGTEFIVSIPPNDFASKPFQVLGLYIGALQETNVTISTSSGVFAQGKVPANDVLLFSSPQVSGQQPLSAGFENWVLEAIVQDKAIMIEADAPVSVYVLNSKMVSSEGYAAVPTKSWGKHYIHCSFWDFNEARTWGGGFQILASEDDTEVTINLEGEGEGLGQTSSGKTIGDQIKVTLDKGELYQVQGAGRTRGIFDLSGTDITADKPIGVVSYHNRTMIPKFIVNSGRDHLSSMLPPVETWEKEYATIEMDRGSDKGDYYRVISPEDNNEVTFTWYDKTTGQVLGNEQITLNANEVWSPYDVDGDINSNPPVQGVNGLIHVKATKRMLVMQYSYSANWDGVNGNYDPFMFPLYPKAIWTRGSIFQTPKNYSGGNEYADNYLNLVYVGDPNDAQKNLEIAESILVDGVKLTDLDPNAHENLIPGTDIFYAYVQDIAQGVHTVIGETEFQGYIYGFANFDSYAWPAVGNVFLPLETGIAPSEITLDFDLNDLGDDGFELAVYTNIQSESDLIQEPVFSNGFDDLFDLTILPLSESSYADSLYEGDVEVYSIKPKDDTKAAKSDFAFSLDGGFGFVADSITYVPKAQPDEFVTLSITNTDLGLVEVNETSQFDVTLNSNPENPSQLTEIQVPSGFTYQLPEGLSLPVENIDLLEIDIFFEADRNEYLDDNTVDDEIIFVTTAGNEELYVTGLVGYTELETSSDVFTVNSELDPCSEEYSFVFTNNGELDAEITDVMIYTDSENKYSFNNDDLNSLLSDFSLNGDLILPTTLAAKSDRNVFDICYRGSEPSQTLFIEPVFDTSKDRGEDFVSDITFDVVGSVKKDYTGVFQLIPSVDGESYNLVSLDKTLNYRLIDLEGKIITSGEVDSQLTENIDTSGLSIGAYILSVDVDGEFYSVQLIID